MHDLDRTLTELNDESADEYGYELESGFADEAEYSDESMAESEELELASELLSVSSEYELDHFLGKLIRQAGRSVGKFVKSPTGRALGGMLKSAAKTALPIVGNAVLPGIGGLAASAVGDAFGLEAEGLSGEDAEWEAAKSFIRFADAAAKNAAQAHPAAPPIAAAKTAVVQAARQHAPGLLRQVADATGGARPEGGGAQSGRWIRRGNKIILLGL